MVAQLVALLVALLALRAQLACLLLARLALLELRSCLRRLKTRHCMHACQRMHLAATAKTPIATPISLVNGFSSQN
jgi:hypothetical protein